MIPFPSPRLRIFRTNHPQRQPPLNSSENTRKGRPLCQPAACPKARCQRSQLVKAPLAVSLLSLILFSPNPVCHGGFFVHDWCSPSFPKYKVALQSPTILGYSRLPWILTRQLTHYPVPVQHWCRIFLPILPWPLRWGKDYSGGSKSTHSKFLSPACWSFFVFS